MDYPKGSGPRRATGLIPSERAPKTMWVNVEFNLFHGFHVKISWGKGGSRNTKWRIWPWAFWRPPWTWRRVLRTIFTPKDAISQIANAKARGECFAPFLSPTLPSHEASRIYPPVKLQIRDVECHELLEKLSLVCRMCSLIF